MTPAELKTAFEKQNTDLQAFIYKADGEIKTVGETNKETKTAIDKIIDDQKTLIHRFDVMEAAQQHHVTADQPRKTLGEKFIECDEMKRWKDRGWHQGYTRMKVPSLEEVKTTITSAAVGSSTPGILVPQRIQEWFPLLRRRLMVRDLLNVTPTTSARLEWVKEATFVSAASPQVEGSAKGESEMTLTIASAAVQTIAHWLPAARQILDDLPQLRDFIDMELMYFLKLKEEDELLNGDGTGQHLDGLNHQATAFNTALLGTSWTKIDMIRRAIQQAALAFFEPDGLILNPTDWADIELTKTTGTALSGTYIIGDPRSLLPPVLWSKPIVVTPAQTSGQFLLGAFAQNARIYDRMDATVDISTEHGSYFTQNLVAVRAEERLGLAVFRPSSFIRGTFNTSP